MSIKFCHYSSPSKLNCLCILSCTISSFPKVRPYRICGKTILLTTSRTSVGEPQVIFFPILLIETSFMDWMFENMFTEIILWLTVAMCKTAVGLAHA